MNRPIQTLNIPLFKINDLHSKGYIYCEDLSDETVDDLKQCIPKQIETKTALDLIEEDAISGRIVSFSESLDKLLEGGVEMKMITEFCGAPGSGKTQLCLQLCVSVQMANCFGGVEGQALFIDTNLGFTTKRLSEIAVSCIKYCANVAETYNSSEMIESLKTFTEEFILKNVHYVKIGTVIELLAIINLLPKFLTDNLSVKLIIIDSITNAMRNTNIESFEKTKILYTLLSDLQKLSNEFNFAIVLTNELTTKLNNKNESHICPSLGETFAHRVNNRIFLKRSFGTSFEAKIGKSVSCAADKNDYFEINSGGVRDIV